MLLIMECLKFVERLFGWSSRYGKTFEFLEPTHSSPEVAQSELFAREPAE